MDGCDYRAKLRGMLTLHKASMHSTGLQTGNGNLPSSAVERFEGKGCAFKSKKNGDLTRHKATKHAEDSDVA